MGVETESAGGGGGFTRGRVGRRPRRPRSSRPSRPSCRSPSWSPPAVSRLRGDLLLHLRGLLRRRGAPAPAARAICVGVQRLLLPERRNVAARAFGPGLLEVGRARGEAVAGEACAARTCTREPPLGLPGQLLLRPCWTASSTVWDARAVCLAASRRVDRVTERVRAENDRDRVGLSLLVEVAELLRRAGAAELKRRLPRCAELLTRNRRLTCSRAALCASAFARSVRAWASRLSSPYSWTTAGLLLRGQRRLLLLEHADARRLRRAGRGLRQGRAGIPRARPKGGVLYDF